jgi:NADH:ubiquinone oxidoreductase subunit 6 (subunit J)
MTLFEYLAIAYALLLSLAAVRLLNGLSQVLHAARRYWAHAIWVCLLLFSALLLFWQHWSTLEVEWTFLTFAMNLAGPGMVYFLACTIIPDDAKGVDSWREYYFSIRRQFFGGLCAWSILMVINTTLILGVPLLHRSRIIPLGLMILGLSGLSTDSPRVHACILLGLSFVLIAAVVILLQPGALAS